MAVKYVKSTTGSDANGGTSWADAYATIAKALGVIAAGDTVYVSQAHAETQASAMTWTSPGTADVPCRIICANDGATPPTATATTGTVSTTGASAITFSTGYAYVYGLTFSAGSSTNLASINLNAAGVFEWVFDHCTIALGNTSASSRIILGLASSSASRQRIELIASNFNFGNAGQALNLSSARFVWRGGTVGGTIPTSLFLGIAQAGGMAELAGVDLSPLASGKNLVSAATTSAEWFYFRNCKLGASVSVITGTIAGQGGAQVFLENCDSGSGNVRMEHYKYQGSIVVETSKIKTSGASDGTTGISHKFVSLTAGPSLFSPLEGPWMAAWNETLTSLTATVEFLHDSLTSLQNSDIYLEVEYQATSGFPESVFSNNRVADVFAGAANCPAGTGTGNWTTSGLTNPNSQKLQVTFTPTLKGPIRWRVCLAKSNYTVYVDPLASGLATPSREYLIAGSVYMNETGSAAGMILSRVRTGF